MGVGRGDMCYYYRIQIKGGSALGDWDTCINKTNSTSKYPVILRKTWVENNWKWVAISGPFTLFYCIVKPVKLHLLMLILKKEFAYPSAYSCGVMAHLHLT